jgi:OMF family outer membrane factor
MAQMQNQLKDAESGIGLEVRQAWLGFQEARQRIANLPQMIASTSEALRIAELRFEAGRATNLEVTDAFLQLRQSKAEFVEAISTLHIAAAELEKATGATNGG